MYDSNTDATVGLSDNRLGNDAVTESYTNAVFLDKNVGTAKTVNVSGISISGTDAGNYTLQDTTASTTANITPAPLTVTATGINRVYDAGTDAAVDLSDNRLGSDVLSDSYASAEFLDKNVGTAKTVTVSGIAISGTDAGNYTLQNTTASTTANITPAPLTVTATAQNKVYDGTTAATVSLATNALAGDQVAAAESAATFADKNVGSAKMVTVSGITTSGTDAGNYTLQNTTATTSASITPATLVVTANNATKVYDAANPALTAAITGFVAGDDAGVVSGTASLSTTATTTSDVGTYPINVARGRSSPSITHSASSPAR